MHAQVLVGQVEKCNAFAADGTDDGNESLLAGVYFGLAEPQPCFAYGCVHDGVGLGLVYGGGVPLLVKLGGYGGNVEPDEVGNEPHDGLVRVFLCVAWVAFDLDEAFEALGAGVKEEAALQGAAGKPFEVFADDLVLFLWCFFGEAQLDVAQCDVAAGGGKAVEEFAYAAADRRQDAQGQPVDKP